MFTFTEEQVQRLKKNFRAIRRALGYKTILDFAQALDKDLKFPGLSHRTIEHYEAPNDSHPITREAVMAYSRVSGIPFEFIVNDDIEKILACDSLAVESGFKPAVVFDDKDFMDDYFDLMNAMFPCFSSDESLKDESFFKAYQIMQKRFDIDGLTPEQADVALKLFSETSFPESHLNLLSLLGFCYHSTGLPAKIAAKDALSLSQNEYNSFLEFQLALDKKRDPNHYELENLKKDFLDRFNGVMSSYMNIGLYDNPDHKDYIYFYLALRYKLGMMDNSICKMTDQEMFVFGGDLLHSLDVMGNKYAKQYSLIANKKD